MKRENGQEQCRSSDAAVSMGWQSGKTSPEKQYKQKCKRSLIGISALEATLRGLPTCKMTFQLMTGFLVARIGMKK